MACRSEERGATARDELLAQTQASPTRVEVAGGFDMLDPHATDRAVSALGREVFDAVFLQAGGWVFTKDFSTVEWCGERYERTTFQNVFGAHATLRALANAGLLAPQCRVVFMGGEGARGIPGVIANPRIDDVEDLTRYVRGDFAARGKYVPVDALGMSKLLGALWTQKLARLSGGDLQVLWFSPGFTGGTGGTNGMPAWQEKLAHAIGFRVMVALGKAQWPAQAGRKCADALRGIVGSHGDVLGAPRGKSLGPLVSQKPFHPAFEDSALQDALWAIMVDALGPIELSEPAVPTARKLA